MSRKNWDVIVVGVGTMGAAALDALARRGVRALGIDAATIPNQRSSHHGRTRLFRTCYYEHPDYTPLLLEALKGWRSLEERSGYELLRLCGGLYIGGPNSELIQGSIRAAEAHKLEYQTLTAREITEHYPMFSLPEDFIGFFEQGAGFVACERAIAAAARRAVESGAGIRPGEPVIDWRVENDGAGEVVVATARDEYCAERIIFCSGAWTSKLVRNLGVQLTATRQALVWVAPHDPSPFQAGSFPCWGIERPNDGGLYYGMPLNFEDAGLKIGLHKAGGMTDPDACVRALLPDDDRYWERVIAEYLPGAAGPLYDSTICLYTNSPDRHFIIDRHPDHERVFLACGFSGHGFKFMPVIGEALADLALDGRTDRAIGFLGLARFRK